jgi:predicted transposase/invertase (TIGR01784 family)
LIPDTQVKTLEQAQEKLQQAINLGAREEEDYWRDWIKGYEEGIAKGELKKAREMALKLLAKGMDITDIAEITGLSETEVSNPEKAFGK